MSSPKDIAESLGAALSPAPVSAEQQPRLWLLEEHLEGGSIRWHTFEHEQQCQARGVASRHEVTITPLFTSTPDLAAENARLREALRKCKTCNLPTEVREIVNAALVDQKGGAA